MKPDIRIHPERVVCQKKAYEDMTSGEYQIPHAYLTARTGGITACVHNHNDDTSCYVEKNLWCVTSDGREHRHEDLTPESRSFEVRRLFGDMLSPDGVESVTIPRNQVKSARIAAQALPPDPYPPIRKTDGSMPYPNDQWIDRFDQTENVYDIDHLPEEMMEKPFRCDEPERMTAEPFEISIGRTEVYENPRSVLIRTAYC